MGRQVLRLIINILPQKKDTSLFLAQIFSKFVSAAGRRSSLEVLLIGREKAFFEQIKAFLQTIYFDQHLAKQFITIPNT
jgi:hypothetical protein